MSGLDVFLRTTGLRPFSVSGKYQPHADRAQYTYRVTWTATPFIVRWKAAIEHGERFVGRPRGAFNPSSLGGGEIETWVRSAVELAIERLASIQLRNTRQVASAASTIRAKSQA